MNLKQQFKTADKAIKDLGLTHPFKLEDIKISPELKKELIEHKAVMVITPKIDESFNTKDLFNRLVTLWDEDNSYFYEKWSEYFKDDYQEPKISFVYMDGKRGLYGKGKGLEDNKTELAKMTDCRSLNPIEYMLLQVIYKDEPLDTGWSWTRFIDAGLRGFIRGGGWNDGGYAGVLALYLRHSPGTASTYIGFRVSRDILTLTSSNLEILEIEYIPETIKVNGRVYRLEEQL